jgi:hypothetical protein
MVILLIIIGGYLLMVIRGYSIVGYFINGYWWLFY